MKYLHNKQGLISGKDLKTPVGKLVYALFFVFLLILAAICLLPVLWAAMSALKSPQELYAIPPTFFPQEINLGNLVRELQHVQFGKYIANTLVIMVGAWVCDVTFNGITGYVLSKVKPLGSALVDTVIFWSMLLPGISMAPLYMFLVDMNLVGSYIPLWLMAGASAFNIMLFRNFFNGIPKEYVEAAKMDGCADIGVFFRIILPLSKPILMVVTIYSVLHSWSTFFWPYVLLGSTDKEPFSVFMYQLTTGNYFLMENEVMAVAMIAIIPPLLMYALFSKHITGGVNMSGVKG